MQFVVLSQHPVQFTRAHRSQQKSCSQTVTLCRVHRSQHPAVCHSVHRSQCSPALLQCCSSVVFTEVVVCTLLHRSQHPVAVCRVVAVYRDRQKCNTLLQCSRETAAPCCTLSCSRETAVVAVCRVHRSVNTLCCSLSCSREVATPCCSSVNTCNRVLTSVSTVNCTRVFTREVSKC